MSLPRVLFVSKPVAPPYRDGTKCLVRDVSRHVVAVEPEILVPRGTPLLSDRRGRIITAHDVYRQAGSYTPAVTENLRAFAWLLARSRADLWHFVFAPNPRTSAAGRFARRLRQKPVVQTVASPPRSFGGIGRLLFGDVVVAQSRWTRQQILEAAAAEGADVPQIVVVPPPIDPPAPRTEAAQRAVRARLEIPERSPVFVYPGDLEVSSGAEQVAAAVNGIAQELPDAVVVFAYRAKTPRAHDCASRLASGLSDKHVRFAHTLPDVLDLVATSRAVLFPVDDLWGKVDLPIVLLEAMALGVPVAVLDQGPLADLEGTYKLVPGQDDAVGRAALSLHREDDHRRSVIAAQHAAVAARYAAGIVAGAYERLYAQLLPTQAAQPS